MATAHPYSFLAAATHGLLTRQHLRRAGVAAHLVDRALRDQALVAETSRVLRVAGAPRTPTQRVLLAVLDSGPGAAAVRWTAAALWALPGYRCQPVHVGYRRTKSQRPSSVAERHEFRRLQPGQIVTVDGVPVTTPARTLLDLAYRIHPDRLRRHADWFLVRRLMRRADLRAVVRQSCGRGFAGSTVFRELADEYVEDRPLPESGLERRFVTIAEEAGLDLERQVLVGGADGPIGRVDCLFRPQARVFEIQGDAWHSAALDVAADADRRRLLEAAGFTVDFVSESDVLFRPLLLERWLRRVRTDRHAPDWETFRTGLQP